MRGPHAIILASACVALAGCVPRARPDADAAEIVKPESKASCDAMSFARFVGEKATAELGAQMLALSGARSLRWAPPRSAMRMDYRPDRLTVRYDDEMIVLSTYCG